MFQTKKIAESGAKAAKNVCLNVYDRTEAFAIDPNGLLCQSRDQFAWHGARATKGVRNHGEAITVLNIK